MASSASRPLAVAAAFALALAGFPSVAAKPVRGGAHPDIAGMWMVREQYYLGQPLLPRPELTPAAKALAAKRGALQAKGYVRSVGNMLCLPNGGPSMFVVRSPFEIFEGFGRITFIFETEGNNQPRTIYLNEAKQPDDIYPTFNGHSIGRWDGRTLVVDTVGYNGRGALLGGVPKSTATHVVERFSWSKDGKVMTLALTAEDPASLAKPWTTQIVFDRMANSEERFEVWCEPDLDAYKTVDLEAVKEGDPEVARLLDPDQRPTDPALKIPAATK
ncbi:MAG: hypothetical protein JF588_03985 [Caulobacterales bacterium]|nr:hypothetical protein [Caulobacterales bacterium]